MCITKRKFYPYRYASDNWNTIEAIPEIGKISLNRKLGIAETYRNRSKDVSAIVPCNVHLLTPVNES